MAANHTLAKRPRKVYIWPPTLKALKTVPPLQIMSKPRYISIL